MSTAIKKLTSELEDMVTNGEDYNLIVKKSQEIDKLIVIEMKKMNKHLLYKVKKEYNQKTT